MDFTEAYRLSTAGSLQCASSSSSPKPAFGYSPGSTFLLTLHLDHAHSTSTLQIRFSQTLQIVRTWSLPFLANSAVWSDDGAHILAVGKQRFVVLALDPSRSPLLDHEENKDIVKGVVANVEVGIEGLSSAQWCGSGFIIVFSQDELLASIYDLTEGSVTIVHHPKKQMTCRSPCSAHIALVTRQASKDCVVVMHPRSSDKMYKEKPSSRVAGSWGIVERFTTGMNDTAGLSWSPDGRYLATWEGLLEYKLQIFTPLGHLRGTYMIQDDKDGMEGLPLSQAMPYHKTNIGRNGKKGTEEALIASGGLGIRCVQWSPLGSVLAIGGYDEKVRLLESEELYEVACIDLSKRIIQTTSYPTTASASPLQAWREPFDWRQETGGRGIVAFNKPDLPVAPAALRGDTVKANPKVGISWISWSPDGSLMAVRNDNVPTAIYIYALTRASAADVDQTPYPHLIGVTILAEAIKSSIWKPGQTRSNDRMGDTQDADLAIVCGTGAIYFWRFRPRRAKDAKQVCEAVPIPIDDFHAVDLSFSSDGTKVMVVSDADTYCCAIEADEGITSVDVSWGEAEL